MRQQMRWLSAGWAYTAAAFFFIACSFSPPAAPIPKTQRIYFRNPQGEGMLEQLALFIEYDDPDGAGDYNELQLKEEATGLEWRIGRETSVFLRDLVKSEHKRWVGSDRFFYPRGYFPEGSYTVTVSDRAGHEASSALVLGSPFHFNTEPFDFALEQGYWKITVRSRAVCTRYSLIMLGADRQPLSVHAVDSFSGDMSEGSVEVLISASPDARYVQCFGENTDGTAGFLSELLPLLP